MRLDCIGKKKERINFIGLSVKFWIGRNKCKSAKLHKLEMFLLIIPHFSGSW